jgi:DNA helicase TIP49 (TBP-interacting protein)
MLKSVYSNFAGYHEQVVDAVSVVCMGLGCTDKLREHFPATAGSILLGNGSNGSNSAVPVPAALLKPPKGLVLHGPPGTGKTTLMKAICTAVGCNFVELSYSILLSR